MGLCALAAVAPGAASQRLRVRFLKAREKELSQRVEEMIAHMKMMRGLLPIGASCKTIRDDGGYWNGDRDVHPVALAGGAEPQHLPECTAKLYPDYHAEMHRQQGGRPPT